MQQPSYPSFALSSLEPAIDRRPLTVASEMPLAQVLGRMGKARSSCVLPSLGIPFDSLLLNEARASIIWVVEQDELLGHLTQQDALQAIATGMPLSVSTVAEVMHPPVLTLTVTGEANQPHLPDLFDTIAQMRQHNTAVLPVLEQGHFIGTVSYASLRVALEFDEVLKARSLSEIVSSPLLQRPAMTSLLDLAQLMAIHRTNWIMLTDTDQVAYPSTEDEVPIGLIHAQDIIQLYGLGLDLDQIQAQAVMERPLCFSPSEPILTAYWHMQQRRSPHFVVATDRGGWCVGTLTCFLETLDLELMRQSIQQLQQSVDDFAIQTQKFSLHPPTQNATQSQPSTEELLEQLECSRLLTTIALRIREAIDLSDILQTAVDQVQQALQTDRVIVYQFNLDLSGTVVREAAAPGWPPAINNTIRDTCFGQNYAQAYQEGRILVLDDIYTSGLTQCHVDILALFDVRASLIVPILQNGFLWGLLCAYQCSNPRHWRSFEIDLLKQVATHMAIAIQQSELYHQLQTELFERQRAEAQLKTWLQEKEVLLKEIHHRVKNNLQVISSVLRLQADYVKDEQTLAMFRDSQHRIRSMALIHEKLYQSSDLLQINFSEYICDLTKILIHSYKFHTQAVDLAVDADNIWFDIDTAIPCGLIINELVSNSLKHAFPSDCPSNKIHIHVSPMNPDQYALTVSDNGIGLPDSIDFRNTDSLGLELVCAFTEQLQGTIELDRQVGTAFTIIFSLLN